MFVVIGIMLSGIFLGYLFRSVRITWMQKVVTVLIWLLLFLLGVEAGSNESVIKGLPTIGLEALIITIAAVAGSVLCAWGLWKYVSKKDKTK